MNQELAYTALEIFKHLPQGISHSDRIMEEAVSLKVDKALPNHVANAVLAFEMAKAFLAVQEKIQTK